LPSRRRGADVRAEVDSGEPRAVGPEGVVAAIASPDGRSLVVITRSGKAVLQPIEGGESRPIPGIEPREWPIGWSTDGRSLYLARIHGLAGQVHRLDLLTGRRELLHELVPPDLAGFAPLPYLAVSADGKSYAYSFIRNLSELFLIEGLK
jgi:hypothetical protein